MNDRNDPQEAWVLGELAQAERELRGIIITMEVSAATAELQSISGWQRLTARMKVVEEGEIEKLRTDKMDPYDLGERQGALRILRHFTKGKPMSEEELAVATQRATILSARIAELRNLLT